MLIDVNVLLYAEDSESPFHEITRDWLTAALRGHARVGFPWQSLVGFVRLRTNARMYAEPLTGDEAWRQVEEWTAVPAAWIPLPTDRHQRVLGELIRRYGLTGNLIPDAHLVALAIEHGIPVASADAGFARFDEIRWINPLRA